jgi:hypothetical protein
MTGDEILADRKNDKDFRWEKKVLAVKQAALDKGFSPNSAKLWVTAARSFFAYHRVQLQFRRSEKARLGEGRAKHEDYRFALSDLQKMHDVGDLTEKYVLTAGKSFGLRAGDFLRLTRGDLEPYINREVPISIGEITTQKEDVKAFPFIDGDALPVIKLMLEKMTREGLTKPDSRVLNYERERQLTRILQRLVSKAGIVTGNKQVRFHCMRKFLIDRLSSFMSESKWKQIVGKQISESAYISPDSLRADYLRAMAETCFQKKTSEEEVKLLAKKEALKILAKAQGYTEDDVRRIFTRKKVSTPEDETRALEELVEKGIPHDCPDGEHCENFAEIKESELLERLRAGWTIVKELSNGQVIVRR